MLSNPLAAVIGVFLVVAALVDLVWTTVASGSGAGPITGRLAPGLWRVFVGVHRRRRSHRFLSASAVVLVLVVLSTWIVLAIVGWWLITLAGASPIVPISGGTGAGAIDRLYFTGYTLFTLGNGDFRPDGALWQMITVAMTGTGLILITLSITYLMPLATAAAAQRRLAAYIFSLGGDPQTMLVRGWTGEGFEPLESHLRTLAPLLHEAGQSHLTYPILHYFHPTDPRTAIPPTFAVLCQALELLDSAVAPQARSDRLTTEMCRQGVRFFLDTLTGAHLEPGDQPVELAPTDALAAAGIPLASVSEYHDNGAKSESIRRSVAGLLHNTGWSGADLSGRIPP